MSDTVSLLNVEAGTSTSEDSVCKYNITCSRQLNHSVLQALSDDPTKPKGEVIVMSGTLRYNTMIMLFLSSAEEVPFA